MASTDLDIFLDTAVGEGLFSNKGRLRFHMEALFRGIELKDMNILDIGGGLGLHSFYASCCEANKVVCLEPEAAGSSSCVMDSFQKLNNRLQHKNIELMPAPIQLFEHANESFDIILLHNSINHLDETACINLQDESKHKSKYLEIFTKIYSLATKGAWIIVCDCSRYNFFNRFGLRSPIAPAIEWHKHQPPEVWARLLREAGFADPTVRWTSFNMFRNWGQALLGNKIAAYFLMSHFCLTMHK